MDGMKNRKGEMMYSSQQNAQIINSMINDEFALKFDIIIAFVLGKKKPETELELKLQTTAKSTYDYWSLTQDGYKEFISFLQHLHPHIHDHKSFQLYKKGLMICGEIGTRHESLNTPMKENNVVYIKDFVRRKK